VVDRSRPPIERLARAMADMDAVAAGCQPYTDQGWRYARLRHVEQMRQFLDGLSIEVVDTEPEHEARHRAVLVGDCFIRISYDGDRLVRELVPADQVVINSAQPVTPSEPDH
jgi:hypothetical protein